MTMTNVNLPDRKVGEVHIGIPSEAMAADDEWQPYDFTKNDYFNDHSGTNDSPLAFYLC